MTAEEAIAEALKAIDDYRRWGGNSSINKIKALKLLIEIVKHVKISDD